MHTYIHTYTFMYDEMGTLVIAHITRRIHTDMNKSTLCVLSLCFYVINTYGNHISTSHPTPPPLRTHAQ